MNSKDKATTSLKQNLLTLAALVENSNDIVIVKDLERRIISGNTNFVRTTGRDSLAELVGKTDAEIMGIPESQEPIHSIMQDDLRALALPLGESYMTQKQLPSKDGRMQTILSRSFPIGDNGKVVSLGIIITDITQIKQMETAREEQSSLVSMIMETSPVGITTVDEAGAITYANSRAEQILGLTRSEITARSYNTPLWQHTDPDGGPFPEERMPFYIVKTTRRSVYDIRHAITWADGTRVILSINASPMEDAEGRFRGMVATIEDITEKTRNESTILRQLEENTILLKEAHHRIKNNIASIEALLTMQLNSVASPEAVSALTDAVARVSSMRVLYENLLISKDHEEISVRSYVESLVDAVASLFMDSLAITIEKRIDEFELNSKTMFPLGIIINELLTNIMKYAFRGRSTGSIQIELARNQSRVSLIIQDNGLGLPEGFDIRLSKGFGLLLVRMLCEQLGGSFTAEGHQGTRSTLIFSV